MGLKVFVLVAAWSIGLGAGQPAHAWAQRSSDPTATENDTTKNEITPGQSAIETSAPDTPNSELGQVIEAVLSELASKVDRDGGDLEEHKKMVVKLWLADARVLGGVQRALAELGYEPGPPDGQVSPETRSAIKEFQALNGIVATGDVTNDLVDRLLMRCQVKVVNFKTVSEGACPKPKESGIPGIGAIEIR